MHPNALEQLRVFQLIVEKGSFSKAAKFHGKAVSAISYTINMLEDQIGFPLFDRTVRHPTLTEKGQTVLRETKILLRRVERMEAHIHMMRSGVEAALTIVVDAAFPQSVLVSTLASFDSVHPHVSLHVSRSNFSYIVEAVREGQIDLGVVPLERGMQWDGIDGRQMVRELMYPVVAPSHPLAQVNGPISLQNLELHRQIHLAEGPPGADVPDYRVHHTDVWLVDSLPCLQDVLLAGLGWGFLPSDFALPMIESGDLVLLDCAEIAQIPSRRFSAIWATARPPGQAGVKLVDQLCDAGKKFGNPTFGTVD